ncbi:MAG: ABC transporter permease [Candidatus Promineifilaceae bacterium]
MKPRWRKVIRDLVSNRTRTILVVLSIAIGVFAVGMIAGTQTMLLEDMEAAYWSTDPSSVTMWITPFDEDYLEHIRKVDGVAKVDARARENLQIQTGSNVWKALEVIAVPDFTDMQVDKLTSESGVWPPPKHGIVIERSTIPLANVKIGDRVMVQHADGKLRELDVVGIGHNINGEPGQFSGRVSGFVTLDTLEWLGFSREFNQLRIQVTGDTSSKAHIREIAAEVEKVVERSGRDVYWMRVPPPGEHIVQDIVMSILALLSGLGLLSLLAAGFLVVNIITGLLTQHTAQIGIMKAIGAKTSQLVTMYLVSVMLFGVLSLLFALPLGAIAAFQLTKFLANLLNFDVTGFRIPLNVMMLEVLVAILVPVLAGLVPVLRGARLSVRQALSEYGLGQGKFGSHFLDRLVDWLTSRVLRLSRPMRISIRNTIRRKARLILTLFTMTLGGAIFLSVMNVQSSLTATLDQALNYFNYDVDVNFTQSHRIMELQQEVSRVDGVAVSGNWVWTRVRHKFADESETRNLGMLGIVPTSELIVPTLLEGRWLQEGDTNKMVINTFVLEESPGLQVGDQVTLVMDDKDKMWEIVGIVQGVMTGPIHYASLDYLSKEIRFVGRSNSIQVIGADRSAASQQLLADRLEAHFESVGIKVDSVETTASLREGIEFQFNILIALLGVMALLVAVVGGLGLSGTMSINVMERTREIGVMRAVGANDRAILRIVLVEGVIIGLISWMLAIVVAYPIGLGLSNIVGTLFLESEMTYIYSIPGAIGWLVAVLFIALLAGTIPARGASRLSVRETLAYE